MSCLKTIYRFYSKNSAPVTLQPTTSLQGPGHPQSLLRRTLHQTPVQNHQTCAHTLREAWKVCFAPGHLANPSTWQLDPEHLFEVSMSRRLRHLSFWKTWSWSKVVTSCGSCFSKLVCHPKIWKCSWQPNLELLSGRSCRSWLWTFCRHTVLCRWFLPWRLLPSWPRGPPPALPRFPLLLAVGARASKESGQMPKRSRKAKPPNLFVRPDGGEGPR